MWYKRNNQPVDSTMFGLSLRDNARISAFIYFFLNIYMLYVSTFDVPKMEYYLSEKVPADGCKFRYNIKFKQHNSLTINSN